MSSQTARHIKRLREATEAGLTKTREVIVVDCSKTREVLGGKMDSMDAKLGRLVGLAEGLLKGRSQPRVKASSDNPHGRREARARVDHSWRRASAGGRRRRFGRLWRSGRRRLPGIRSIGVPRLPWLGVRCSAAGPPRQPRRWRKTRSRLAS